MFKCSEIREENEKKAREYARKIVNLIADNDYEAVLDVIDDDEIGVDTLSEIIECYEEDNNIIISPYDAAEIPDITYKDGSRYKREQFYYNEEDKEDFDFSYECDLLPTDLTLMLEFVCVNGMYRVILDDVHQL